jgi:hypothetical protein
MYRFKQQTWLTALLLLTLTACGGGSDSVTETVSTGVFIDSVVDGLQYKTATRSGTTNSLGEYDYLAGETVTFSIGGIVLGSSTADPVETPLSLVPGATSVTNPEVTNIKRLLLSLDSDGDPDNGVAISREVTTAANDLAVDFSLADLSLNGAISLHLPPTATDYNYALGTVWIDTTATDVYIFADNAAVDGAVWVNLKQAAAAVKYYAIGEDGPAGGKVFYITDDGAHGLEAAPEDQATSEWGCAFYPYYRLNTDQAIGTGMHNTEAIVAGCRTEKTAAEVAQTYKLGTYSDWFLPSREELQMLSLNHMVVGGFSGGRYWSSSQYHYYSRYIGAWSSYIDGNWHNGADFVGNLLAVRAVRAF